MSELSTGSRRLVDLAAVVAHQPSVVLLDEPSSGVAQREVEAMVDLLRNVRAQLDATLLIVEHDITFIAGLANRLVAMDRGTVLVSGEPDAVLGSRAGGGGVLGDRSPGPVALGAGGHCNGHGGRDHMSEPEQTPTSRPWPRVGRLRLAIPVVLIIAALVAAGIVATVNERSTTNAAAPANGTGAPTTHSSVPLTYAAATMPRPRQRVRLGSPVRPQNGSSQDADRLRTALRAGLHRRPTAAPRRAG